MINVRKSERQSSEIFKRRTNPGTSQRLQERERGEDVQEAVRMKTLTRAKRHEVDKVVHEIKGTLPYLRPSEVRRFYTPHHEAVLLELEEGKHQEVAERMKELLELDEEIRRKAGPGTLVWKKSRLSSKNEFLDLLASKLLAHEAAKTLGDFVAQANLLLDLALFFQSEAWEWWWLAEEFYGRTIAAATQIRDDNRETITLAKYLYGRFLFEQMDKPEEALDCLNEAREASEGMKWNASNKLKQPQSSVFKECSFLLYKILLKLAEKLHADEPQLALKACEQALIRATDTEKDLCVIDALHELGKCNLRCGNTKAALQNFSKLLAIAKRIPDAGGICNAHKELAFAYKRLNNDIYTEKHLRLFKENATRFELTDKIAEAHYYIGEQYLSKGKPSLATSHLELALSLYSELGLSGEASQARSIAGVSKGQERIAEYLSLILRSGEGDSEAVLKLLRWKDRREEFWVEDDKEDASSESVDHGSLENVSSASVNIHESVTNVNE